MLFPSLEMCLNRVIKVQSTFRSYSLLYNHSLENVAVFFSLMLKHTDMNMDFFFSLKAESIHVLLQ